MSDATTGGADALDSDRPATGAVTVAFDGGPLLGPRTGIGAAVAETAAALGDRDDVDLRPYALSFRGTLPDGMTRLPLPAAVAQRMWSRVNFPNLDRWLRPAQVVHGTNYAVGPSRLPRIVSVYDCWFLRNPEHASPTVVRAGQVLRRAVAGGALVHASSRATADAVRELLGTDRVEVILLAALAEVAPTATPDQVAPVAELAGMPFVLAIGTLERRKNLPRLIAAFGIVAAADNDVRLVLVGADGDDRPAIDTAIDVLPTHVTGRIIRTGRTDAAVKHWLLDNARVLAYPSLDEGFGFPLLEAMQHQLPIVASTMGSIPEIAGSAALLVDPGDTDALASALQRALVDESVRSDLVAHGTARLDDFSWSETARQLAGVYHRLAEEGS